MAQAVIHISAENDPYQNLATERLLMETIAPHEQIMFLWQNSHTIVIGRNQDAYRECRVEAFECDGGHLARRLSGGGAVYHDVGNLNFTFISPRATYDVTRNLAIMCRAVRSFGVAAEVSGRNDVEVEAAKFSGNAFFETKAACCHHGTLMVAVDTEKLSHYLQPDPRKLQTRGVKSVKSRVVNLHDIEPRITVASLREALLAEFCKEYGVPAMVLVEGRLDPSMLERERERFASSAWQLGAQHSFSHRFDHRYAWGGIDLRFNVTEGTVHDARVYSDVLDTDFVDALTQTVEGLSYERAAFEKSFSALAQKTPSYQSMLSEFLTDLANDLEKDA